MHSVESEVESSQSGTGTPDRGLPKLAFGAERMGLVSLKAPVVVGLVFLVLAIGSVFGLQRLKGDDSLSQLVRAHTPSSSSTRR